MLTLNQPSQTSLKVKLIDLLGLRNFIIDHFVYRPPNIGKTLFTLISNQGYTIEIENDLLGNPKLAFYILNKNKKIFARNPAVDLQTFIISTHNPNATGSYCPAILIRNNNSCCSCHNFNITSIPTHQNPSYQRSLSQHLFQELNPPFQDFDDTIKSKKEQTKSFLPEPSDYNTNAKTSRLLVIFSHGNASDLRESYIIGEKLVQLYDVDFLAYDYTGYGLGKNKQVEHIINMVQRYKIEENQIYDDLQNVLAFAVQYLGYQLDQIILWGFSLGSGPTVEIATRFVNILGVVLQAPIASLVMWLDEKKKEISLKDKDIFSNINKIQAIKSRIFMMHGNQDSIVNIRHSRMLYDKYIQNTQQQKIWYFEVTNTDHNDLEMLLMNENCELHDKMVNFIEDLELIQSSKKQLSYQEPIERDQKLLSLISEKIIVQKDMVEKQLTLYENRDSLMNQSKSLIMPIEDLYSKQMEKYPNFFQTKKEIKNEENVKKQQRFSVCICTCQEY